MISERRMSCVDERRIECDSIREDVASKLVILMEYQNMCHGFGFMQPACVIEAAGNLRDAGCVLNRDELLSGLNPENIE